MNLTRKIDINLRKTKKINKTNKNNKNNKTNKTNIINAFTNLAITSGLEIPYKINTNITFNWILPKNTFGLFVSVKRSKKNKYNDNIHGCIGNWNQNYTNINIPKIINILKNVSYSSTNTDYRKDNFDELYKDPTAIYEISLMLNPLFTINITSGIMSNGIKFNNNIYGVIVVYNNNKATYLPKVFPNKTWINIRNSLIEKSMRKKIDIKEINDILLNNNIKFFAYKVNSLLENNYINYIINEFIININKNYKEFIPYEFKNGFVLSNPDQYVRNCGMLYTLSKIYNQLDTKIQNVMINNILYYINKFNTNKLNMRQAAPFLLLSIYTIKKNTKYIKTKNYYKKIIITIKNFLESQIENIETNNIDKNFELGEICMALNIIKPKTMLLKKIDNIMYNEIKYETANIKLIFRINWHIKFIFNNPYNVSYNEQHKKLLIQLIEDICAKLSANNETNYLAVGFEALNTCKSNRKDLIFKLFYFLQKRFKNGVYYFQDLSVARYDITGHVLDNLI